MQLVNINLEAQEGSKLLETESDGRVKLPLFLPASIHPLFPIHPRKVQNVADVCEQLA